MHFKNKLVSFIVTTEQTDDSGISQLFKMTFCLKL